MKKLSNLYITWKPLESQNCGCCGKVVITFKLLTWWEHKNGCHYRQGGFQRSWLGKVWLYIDLFLIKMLTDVAITWFVFECTGTSAGTRIWWPSKSTFISAAVETGLSYIRYNIVVSHDILNVVWVVDVIVVVDAVAVVIVGKAVAIS